MNVQRRTSNKKNRQTRAVGVAFIVLVCWLWALPALAYVLEGPHILELMVDRLGTAQSLFVSQKLIFHRQSPPANADETAAENAAGLTDENRNSEILPPIPASEPPPDHPLELDESLRYIFSEAFRSDVKSPGLQRIYIFNAGRALTIIDGYIVDNAENRFELYKDILLYRSRQTLSDRLTALGVDVSTSSLGRYEGKIAFVVGADYPDASVPQLWVDKETLLPMRWIIQPAGDDSGAGALEVHFLQWWKIGKTRYPSRIEFYQDGNLVRECRSINFEENAQFSRELFDIDQLQTLYQRQPPKPVDEQLSGKSSEVQNAIEEFQKLFD